MKQLNWATEFKQVVSCRICQPFNDKNLLRDDLENVPQPGYIGQNYQQSRVVLIGQNPGTPKTLEDADRPYTAALRHLRDNASNDSFEELNKILRDFIPKWPVHGNYFPLIECGLTLEDIAYLNVVRCRTISDKKPSTSTISNCTSNHLGKWLDLLVPKVVIFIGKWAADNASHETSKRNIPFAFMNRQRSLSTIDRIQNREAVVNLVSKFKS